MAEKKFFVSSVQIFFLIFSYMLSGLILYANGSAVAALFACLFCVCVCVVAAALCKNYFSSREFYSAAFGFGGGYVRYICAVVTAYALANTLLSFSEEAAIFYRGEVRYALLLMAAALAVFSVLKGFGTPARFAEICVFPLLAAVLISLLGGKGRGLYFGFSEDMLFTGFEIIGAVPVFFSLFLRNVTEKSGKMSDYAKNSAFHPSPLACGICAVFAALVLYAFFCFAEGENIMLSFFLWFAVLVRAAVYSITVCDLVGIPESSDFRAPFFAVTLCAVIILLAEFFADTLKTTAIFANVIFPCAVFAAVILKQGYGRKIKSGK